jgi:hypothetical protein
MKRWVLASGLGVILAVLAAVWFFDTFEQVDGKVWVGPSGAARSNPYLAATRFMTRMGFRITEIERPAELDHLAPGATLVLLARRAVVTPERAQTLARWAAAGGHLIVEPEPQRYRDVMLESLGITRKPAAKAKPAPTLAVEFPGVARTLQVTPSPNDALEFARATPDLIVADAGGIRLASLRHGSGRVSVVTGFQRFSNRGIGAHDNAELLWQLLRLTPDNQSVMLLRSPQATPLIAWLYEHASAILLSSLTLLALWLWCVAPRFGPIIAGSAPQRHQLLEHIRACGRFRWASGARSSLLDAAREICRARIARLRPRLAHLANEQGYRELSTEIDIGADEIAYAFDGAPRGAREFVHMVATLASIHRNLSHTLSTPRLQQKRK